MKIAIEVQYEIDKVNLQDEPEKNIQFHLKPDAESEWDEDTHRELHAKLKEASEFVNIDLKIPLDDEAQETLDSEGLAYVYGKPIGRLEITNVPPIYKDEQMDELEPRIVKTFHNILDSGNVRDIMIHIESWKPVPNSLIDNLMEEYRNYIRNNNIKDDCNISIFAKYRFDIVNEFFKGNWNDDLVSDQEVISASIDDTNRINYDNLIPRDPRTTVETGEEEVSFD